MWKTTLLILRGKCSALQSSPGCSSAVRCWRAEGGNAVSKIRRFCAEPRVGEPEPDLAASRETESRADQVVWWALASVPSLQHSTCLYWRSSVLDGTERQGNPCLGLCTAQLHLCDHCLLLFQFLARPPCRHACMPANPLDPATNLPTGCQPPPRGRCAVPVYCVGKAWSGSHDCAPHLCPPRRLSSH